MTTIMLLNIIGYGIVLATWGSIGWTIIFFRRERKKNDRYAFFRLRSKLHKIILVSDNTEEFDKLDDGLTRIICDLQAKQPGWSFFVHALENGCDDFVRIYDEKGVEGLQAHLDRSLSNDSPKRQIERELLVLLLDLARKNNFVLKLATSSVGYQLFIQYHLMRAFLRRDAKNIKRKKYATTIETYSVIGNSLTEKYA